MKLQIIDEPVLVLLSTYRTGMRQGVDHRSGEFSDFTGRSQTSLQRLQRLFLTFFVEAEAASAP